MAAINGPSRMVMIRRLLILALLAWPTAQLQAEEKSIEAITQEVKPSLVAITHKARADRGDREGSGFVIAEGLIATNLHVIGEARPIEVETSEGEKLTVTGVHASDRKWDLAILAVKEATPRPLQLGDSEALQDGMAVVAMGNPQGFRFSVVEGVISARRELNGVEMIQLAIPIEPGNSGGPLLDRKGKVIGVPTMKSLATDNIGFAMPVNALKLLLEKPNPIPIERWMTVGQLSPRKWQVLQNGAKWTQRAGKITVDGLGAGFGGRSLCLHREKPEEATYEVSVKVKLDDDTGAAGLAFASDGKDRHYGFYPSNGRLRLTHFNGPDVFSWDIIAEIETEFYHPGEWNHLRVEVDPETIRGFVNGQQVVTAEHSVQRDGQAGICQFRQTAAEFQGFMLGAGLGNAAAKPDEAAVAAVNAGIEALLAGEDLPAALSDQPQLGNRLMEQRARKLEEQAESLRRTATRLHQQAVCQEMTALLDDQPDEAIDLTHAGLLIARLYDSELEVAAYRGEFDAMADEIRASLPEQADDETILKRLGEYLFQELGFHGSRSDYYSRENSFLNVVLDDREGLPITLSVIFIEIAHRLGVNTVVGLPLPGHFVVQYRPEDETKRQILDPFDGGKALTRDEAEAIVMGVTGRGLQERDLEPVDKRAILVRMLRNLIGLEVDSEDAVAALPALDLLLSIAPDEAQERLQRTILRYQSRDLHGALVDAEWILEKAPAGVHLERIEALQREIQAMLR